MTYRVTKTYGHHLGLSTCFRQWRAESHCRFLHGYALSIKLTFVAHHLNSNNWAIDFGSLKPIKQWIMDTFDHKTLVAKDDPALPLFRIMNSTRQEKRDDGIENIWDEAGQLVDLIEVDDVGCEAFAKMIFDHVSKWLMDNAATLHGGDNGVVLESVEVREHDANSAIYGN